MPLFIAALLGGLVSAAGSFVGRALIALGIGVVAFTGVSAALNVVRGQVIDAMNEAGPLLDILALLKVDVAITILFSAITARLVLNGLTGDTIKRWVIK